MSAHGHGHSAPKEHPLVLLPGGARLHNPPQPAQPLGGRIPLLKIHGHEAQRFQAVAPERVFEHNTPGMAAENFKTEAVLAGHLEGDTTASLNVPEQNFYAMIENGINCVEPAEAVRIARDTLTNYWQAVEATGETIDINNVEQYMEQSLARIRQELVNAGISEEMSVGVTAAKLFRHGDGWGAAIAHAGNTTHGFITNRDKKPLHNNDEGTRTGQIISTQNEFTPYINREKHRESSLNSDPSDTVAHQRVSLIPRLRKDSWIVLCNDQVTGMSDPKHAQKPEVRDEALLDQRDADGIPDPVGAARVLLNDRHNPEGGMMIIRLQEVPEAAIPEATADAGGSRLSASFRKIVALATRGAGVMRAFWESEDPKIKRRRHMVEAAAALAVLGAGYYTGRKLYPEQVKGLEQKILDGKAKKKAGELAVRAAASIKRGKETATESKPAKRAVELGAKSKEKLVDLKQKAPAIIKTPVKAVEVVEEVVAAAPEATTGIVKAARKRATVAKDKAQTLAGKIPRRRR